MIDTQIEDDIQEYDQSLRNQGMNLDQYLQYLNSTLEDFKKDIEETSIRKLKTRLVMEEIIKNEDFEVTDKEINLIRAEIDKTVNADTGFRPCELIHRFCLLPDSFSVGRELSAKQEFMRYKIEQIYAKQIRSLF